MEKNKFRDRKVYRRQRRKIMKERPILFSSPMVRAILSGQKTMTRRIVNRIVWNRSKPPYGGQAFMDINPCHRENPDGLCPYGQPGDLLWVRETFYYEEHMHDLDDDEPDLPGGLYSRRIIYRASWPDYIMVPGRDKWAPSIFMPRAFSRITLEITNVRVERLQDIGTGDIFSEGMEMRPEDDDGTTWGGFAKAEDRFIGLWEAINGPGSWNANPWVWVIEFKRIEP